VIPFIEISHAAVQSEPAPRVEARFAGLVGEGWNQLPAPIRRRFSHLLADGERIIYLGDVAHTTIRPLGRIFAQLARLVGAPLPMRASGRLPVAVIVTGCERLGGQLWTRIYDQAGGFPQVIQSLKCFGGTTGLEERVGGGVGMRLTLRVENRALVFRSTGYFVQCLGMQVSIPGWLTPGIIEVIHREEAQGRFSFSLSVTHVWAGRIIDQIAFFREGHLRRSRTCGLRTAAIHARIPPCAGAQPPALRRVP
jgi:Domain of unknown function (DUF4166)